VGPGSAHRAGPLWSKLLRTQLPWDRPAPGAGEQAGQGPPAGELRGEVE
jgi:hypothetical protein